MRVRYAARKPVFEVSFISCYQVAAAPDRTEPPVGSICFRRRNGARNFTMQCAEMAAWDTRAVSLFVELRTALPVRTSTSPTVGEEEGIHMKSSS